MNSLDEQEQETGTVPPVVDSVILRREIAMPSGSRMIFSAAATLS